MDEFYITTTYLGVILMNISIFQHIWLIFALTHNPITFIILRK